MARGDRTAEHAASFGRAADVYEAARPSYPREAVDWLVPASARRVLDLGAGTGKLTRMLVERGLDAVAVDPAPEMLEQLARRVPGVETLVGTAEDVPLPDASVDAVTVAQAWHWVDAARAVAEVARVLRPGGTLGLVWNSRDESVGWVAELGEIIGGTPHHTRESLDPIVGGPFGELERWTTRWEQELSLDGLLDLVRSRSYMIVKQEDEKEAVLERVRALVASVPRDGAGAGIRLPYVTECFRAERAG